MCDLGYTQWGSRETITRYGVGKKAFAVAAKQNALSPALGAMQSFPCWHTKELNWRKLWRAPEKKIERCYEEQRSEQDQRKQKFSYQLI